MMPSAVDALREGGEGQCGGSGSEGGEGAAADDTDVPPEAYPVQIVRAWVGCCPAVLRHLQFVGGMTSPPRRI